MASTRSAAAAAGASAGFFHRIDAQPSGLITEYTEWAHMSTRSPMASASAPPLPPSPVITVMMGTGRPAISRRFSAIATDWARSSADTPG